MSTFYGPVHCLGAFFLSAACERVEQHDPAQQGSNQPCGLLLSARETPTTGIAKQLEIERFWAAFLFLLSFLYFGVFWEDAESFSVVDPLTA